MAKRERPAKRPGQARRARAAARSQRGTRAFEAAAVPRAERRPARRGRGRGQERTDRSTHFFWTDQFEQAYVVLRDQAGHWQLEWGDRNPPASDTYVPRGEHVSSDREEVMQRAIEQMHRLSDDRVRTARAEAELRALLEPRGSKAS